MSGWLHVSGHSVVNVVMYVGILAHNAVSDTALFWLWGASALSGAALVVFFSTLRRASNTPPREARLTRAAGYAALIVVLFPTIAVPSAVIGAYPFVTLIGHVLCGMRLADRKAGLPGELDSQDSRLP